MARNPPTLSPPALVSLMEFGTFLQDRAGGVALVHADCGGRLHAAVMCTNGHVVALDDAAAQLAREGASER